MSQITSKFAVHDIHIMLYFISSNFRSNQAHLLVEPILLVESIYKVDL